MECESVFFEAPVPEVTRVGKRMIIQNTEDRQRFAELSEQRKTASVVNTYNTSRHPLPAYIFFFFFFSHHKNSCLPAERSPCCPRPAGRSSLASTSRAILTTSLSAPPPPLPLRPRPHSPSPAPTYISIILTTKTRVYLHTDAHVVQDQQVGLPCCPPAGPH